MTSDRLAEPYPPIPTLASKKPISTFAEHVASELGFCPGDVLEPLVTRLGGKMSYFFGQGVGNEPPPAIVAREMRDFTIFIPTNTSQIRDRFTIAHELGHLFLHLPMVQKRHPGASMRATRWVDPTDPDQQRAEVEANWFAASFLMPGEAFRNDWDSLPTSGRLETIARRFAVSSLAAQYRANALGLSAV